MVKQLSNEDLITHVQNVANDIKSMKIKGATTIAIKAIETIKFVIERSPLDKVSDLFTMSIDILRKSRPTEPAMFNGLTYVYNRYVELKTDDPAKDRELIIHLADSYLNMLKSSFEKIIDIGSRLIPEKATIVTHCHSSTVTQIILKAKNMGKNVRVISTETRPIYQGRITARELSEAGIEVYHIVDSAMHWAFNKYKPDLVLIGADAISSVGTVINKIGSNLLALVAKEHSVPLYIATTLLKMDIRTIYGVSTEIEMRPPKEVWEEAPENVKILNPAFEVIEPKYIRGIISEAGIIPPNLVTYVFKERYPEILHLDREAKYIL